MAGTIQTLILNPSSSVTPSFRHGHPHFRSIRISPPFLISLPFNHGRPIPIRASQLPNHSNGSEPSRSSKLVWSKPLLNFASQNFLPLALIGGVALGLVNPSLGCLADKYNLSKFSSFSIFIISGLTLRNGEIGDAVHAWKIGLLGLCSILLFTPYFSRIILQLQLQPQEFVTGLAIFCCMPTTLSSGVALTQLAGGNSALALAMTVISNLLGILIVPFSISRFIAAGVGVTIPTKQLFKSLVLTLLVPLILGKVFRESFKGLRDFVDQNRKLFSNMSAVLLSLVPFIQVSRSRSLLLMVKPTVFVVAVAMGVLLHLILLGFNFLALGGLSAASGGNQSFSSEKENAVAYLLVASQKTLPVMVAVVEQLGGAFGESGLLVLPCVAAHINQIIIDSFLVNFWFRKDLVSTDAKLVLRPSISLLVEAYGTTFIRRYKCLNFASVISRMLDKAGSMLGRCLFHFWDAICHLPTVVRILASGAPVFQSDKKAQNFCIFVGRERSEEVVEELGVYIVSFDRPGYGESDPDHKRTPKSLAHDIEDLADNLGFGSKFYVIGNSMGGQAVWSCLKYIPHRLAGATLLAPVINYWWSGFPANLSREAYYKQLPQDQWTLRVAHYTPWLTYWWNTQKWFPASGVAARRPEVFSSSDLQLTSKDAEKRLNHRMLATQQGELESLHGDLRVGFGRWEFDPMDLENPFPNNVGSVHLWQGDDDRMVPVSLQRFIVEKLPWIHYHELHGNGHVFTPEMSEAIVKSLLLGQK